MLISTMLTCPEGLKFLLEDQLLKQLSTAVLEIEAVRVESIDRDMERGLMVIRILIG